MASEDIIHHIIKDIVSRSNAIFKSKASENSEGAVISDYPEIFEGGIPSEGNPNAVSDTLAAFLIRSVVLDPENDFGMDRELNLEKVETLTQTCIEKITDPNDVQTIAVKMQVYFDTTFPAQNDFLHRENLLKSKRSAPLLTDIMDVKQKSISSYEILYRKIVSYLLIKSHVGNAMDLRVVRESTAALESIFPQSELSTFISLIRSDKEMQLNGLSQLVTGIRLFNKELGKGGETIEAIPTLCIEELKKVLVALDQQTTRSEDLLQIYAAICEYAYGNPENFTGEVFLRKVKMAIAFCRQSLIYLDAIREQVIASKSVLKTIAEKFEDTVTELKKVCKAKTAVPVDQPLFMTLSSLWSSWTDELFLILFKKGVLKQMSTFEKSISTLEIAPEIITDCYIYRKDVEPEIQPESKIISRASELMIKVAIITKSIEIIHPGNTTEYYKLPVEYGGFCPATLIERDGVLIPGDKNIGMLKYRDRIFAFANLEMALLFAKTPDKYLEGVLLSAKKSYYLVQLLHLYGYFPTVEALEKAKSFTRQRMLGQKPITSEISTQVDTHILDSNIDTKYRWNEWELRRHALLLVNLKTKKTHSSQTGVSHFRRESETQYYSPKDQNTQTLKNSSTMVPRTVHFLKGLRYGEKEKHEKSIFELYEKKKEFKIVDLTVDEGGTPLHF